MPSGHHTSLSLHVTLFLYVIFLVIAFFYLKCHVNGFGWWQLKQSYQSTSMCKTQPSFYKWRNTPCHWTYKWVQIYKTCWFEFWQPSDLTRRLGECLVLSYPTMQEAEWFFGKIYGSTPARSIDEMQSNMFVSDMSIEKFAATRDALFSQGALSQPDSSHMTSKIADCAAKVHVRL